MARKKTDFKKIITWIIAWRLGLFLLSALAGFWLVYDPSFPYAIELLNSFALPRWFYSWANFDGVHYLMIAQQGYLGTGLIQAFFPIFPLLLRCLPSLLVGGLILNTILTTILIVVFFELIKLDHSVKVAHWSIIALLLFPTSFFLGALYTEAVFLSLVMGSFLLARQKKWLWAGILAGIASATRIIGIFLWPALLVELWWQAREINLSEFLKQHLQKIGLISLGSLGLLSYMFYLWQVFGDPLYFLHVQQEFGTGRQESLVLFPQVLWRYAKILWTARPFDWKYFSYAQELFLSLGVLGSLLVFFKKIRPSYLVFSLLAFFLPTVTGTLSSMPRYVLICFPIFILLGKFYLKNKLWRVLLLTISITLLIINTILFIQGYWVA
ncbi:MAG: hypothetical protein A2383_01700 [Candidatus Pacebacteria bacterium RIFOXYB1_FULL_39_46]|nr:MAG: hypothetical protein A2182_03215 [Candidatus Pacebacteria bacterium RIFOXYA1_FULL_38_18]OGJ37883.1 MAG: hypothetical protein A2383_01700 [Candidatus Pacebacteria bacterium RIFOXYB1_FULL_39_46]OGJ39482.1 MAG: hypothetical protein A2411_01855 [Candidatus Pacebacteria bacterium RIFOXYC1_FULL_39_21]OGJ40062.1 MAG: hypothetical protein A2582_03145 [Candidatus Pacebacteria bacterium RIFOXYD1_FULL_39_27]